MTASMMAMPMTSRRLNGPLSKASSCAGPAVYDHGARDFANPSRSAACGCHWNTRTAPQRRRSWAGNSPAECRQCPRERLRTRLSPRSGPLAEPGRHHAGALWLPLTTRATPATASDMPARATRPWFSPRHPAIRAVTGIRGRRGLVSVNAFVTPEHESGSMTIQGQQTANPYNAATTAAPCHVQPSRDASAGNDGRGDNGQGGRKDIQVGRTFLIERASRDASTTPGRDYSAMLRSQGEFVVDNQNTPATPRPGRATAR